MSTQTKDVKTSKPADNGIKQYEEWRVKTMDNRVVYEDGIPVKREKLSSPKMDEHHANELNRHVNNSHIYYFEV